MAEKVNYADDFGDFMANKNKQISIIPTAKDLDASRPNIHSNTMDTGTQQLIEQARVNKDALYRDPRTGKDVIPPQEGLQDTSMDMADVASMGAAGLVARGVSKYGGKMIDSAVNKDGLSQFGQDISKQLPHNQKLINETVDTVEGLGGTKFDDESLIKVAKDVLPVTSREQTGLAGAKALGQARKEKETIVTNLYKAANKEGATTKEFNTSSLTDKIWENDKELQRVVTSGKVENTSTVNAYKDIKALFDDSLPSNAVRLEEKRKYLGDAYGDAEGKARSLYKKAIDALDVEQDKLLKGINKPNLYKDARNEWKSLKTEFEGKRFSDEVGGNTGATGGKAIKEAIESGDMYNLSKTLFGDGLDPDKVMQVAKHIKGSALKKELGLEVLLKGVGRDVSSTNPITSYKGMNTFISNVRGADDKSLSILFGKDGADNLRKSVNSMELIQTVIKHNKGEIKGISEDVLGMMTSVALFKVSPYVSARTFVGAAKNMASKVLFNKEKKSLIKRTSGIQDPKIRGMLLKSLKALKYTAAGTAAYKTLTATGGSLDSKTSTISKLKNKFSLKPLMADELKISKTNQNHITKGAGKLNLSMPTSGVGIDNNDTNRTFNIK